MRLVRRRQFRFKARAGLVPPVFGDGCLFVADPDGEITAIDTETYEVLWRSPADSFWPADCLDGVLVTQSIHRMATRAFDSSTGRALWERADVAAVRWRNGLLAIDGTGCRIAVADTRTGEPAHEWLLPMRPLLVLDDAVILHPEPSRIRRFDPEQQAVVWDLALPDALTVKPHSVLQEQILLCRYSCPYLLLQQRHSFGGIDIRTGELLWHLVLPTGFLTQRLLLGQWIVWSSDEALALAPATGHALWSLPTKKLHNAYLGRDWTTMQGRLICLTLDRRILVLSTQDGSVVGEYTKARGADWVVGSATHLAVIRHDYLELASPRIRTLGLGDEGAEQGDEADEA